jgi:hypothetical protein
MPLRRRNLVLALVLVAVGASSCITRPVRQKVFDDGRTQAYLRSHKRGTASVAKGYQHPVDIAPVRMAHILSRIDVRKADEEGKRTPAIPLETLFAIADALSEALEQAEPDQQVAIQSSRKVKSLLVFDHFYLTSLLAYLQDDLLYIHISRADWEVPKRREKQAGGLPETHEGVYPLDFRLVVDEGMTLVDHQAVAVQWRDDIFRKPTRTRVTSTGKVVRRQVLMESLEDESIERPTPNLATDLSPAQLRALADLEESRENGEVSETEYQSMRGRILRGEPVAP